MKKPPQGNGGGPGAARPGSTPPNGRKSREHTRPPSRPQPLKLISPNRAAGAEWVGGRVPTSVDIEEGGGFRPNLLVWIEQPTDIIVGSRLVEPRGSEDDLGALLLTCLEAPAVGEPRRPGSIRVAHERLAREVRAAVGDSIPIRVAPTPEVDAALRSFEEYLDGGLDPTYLGDNESLAPHFEELFAVARGLVEAKAWDLVGDHLLRLDVPELEVNGVCVSFMAGADDEIGLLIFPSFEACTEFGTSLPDEELDDAGELDFGTSWIGLTFGTDEEVPPSLLEEAQTHGWAFQPGWFPILQSLARDGEPLDLTERDVRLAAAAARAALATATIWNQAAQEGRTPADEPLTRSFTTREGHEVHFAGPWDEFEFSGPGDQHSD